MMVLISRTTARLLCLAGGRRALANVAVDRALDDDPRYSMALLLREALDSGAPPSMARLPMTPGRPPPLTTPSLPRTMSAEPMSAYLKGYCTRPLTAPSAR
jgi:hypothetical protein